MAHDRRGETSLGTAGGETRGMAMVRTPRVGLVVAASVLLCALAAVVIGGLGIHGVSSA